VEHHQPARDRKPEPGALDVVLAAAMRALERREQAAQRLGRDADAGVGDADRDLAAVAAGRGDRDGPAFRRELDRVRQQVAGSTIAGLWPPFRKLL